MLAVANLFIFRLFYFIFFYFLLWYYFKPLRSLVAILCVNISAILVFVKLNGYFSQCITYFFFVQYKSAYMPHVEFVQKQICSNINNTSINEYFKEALARISHVSPDLTLISWVTIIISSVDFSSKQRFNNYLQPFIHIYI